MRYGYVGIRGTAGEYLAVRFDDTGSPVAVAQLLSTSSGRTRSGQLRESLLPSLVYTPATAEFLRQFAIGEWEETNYRDTERMTRTEANLGNLPPSEWGDEVTGFDRSPDGGTWSA